MRRALLHEFRRDLLPLAVLGGCAAVISVVFAFNAHLTYSSGEPWECCGDVFTAILCILCAVVPCMQFAYRMKMRSADLWYSLPLTRRQLLFVRIAGGLLLVLAPYTFAYWLGVACIAMQTGVFEFVHYLSLWAVSVPLGVLLFGVNSFLFTRADSVGDGVVFLALWACILPLAVYVFGFEIDIPLKGGVGLYPRRLGNSEVAGFFFPYSPLAYCSGLFESLICAEKPDAHSLISLAFVLPLAAAEGAAAYTALFVCAKRDRAENAEQPSSSWMGYKVLLPAYIVLLLAFLALSANAEIVLCVLVAVAGAVMYFVYRRSFRLQKADLISYAAALAVGAALAALLWYFV